MTKNCPVCQRPRASWPAIFRGEDACSVNCQKALEHEPTTEQAIAPSECST